MICCAAALGIEKGMGYLAGHIEENDILSRIHKLLEKIIIGIGVDHGSRQYSAFSHALIYSLSRLFFTIVAEQLIVHRIGITDKGNIMLSEIFLPEDRR